MDFGGSIIESLFPRRVLTISVGNIDWRRLAQTIWRPGLAFAALAQSVQFTAKALEYQNGVRSVISCSLLNKIC